MRAFNDTRRHGVTTITQTHSIVLPCLASNNEGLSSSGTYGVCRSIRLGEVHFGDPVEKMKESFIKQELRLSKIKNL